MDWRNIVFIILSFGLISSIFLIFRNKRKEIALSLFSIVFALSIAEMITKLFYPQIMEHDKMFEYDSNLGWKFVSNKKGSIVYDGEANHYIETNSRGFRDGPYLPNKEKTKEILVLGDSFVSNIAVKDSDVFTEILEGSLQSTEVLNFGVNGYGQVQEYLLLEKWNDSINPDIIILMIYIRNDFTDNMGGLWHYPRPFVSWDKENITYKINPTPELKDTKPAAPPGLWRIYRKSHLYQLISKRIKSILFTKEIKSNLEPSIFTPPELYLCNKQPSENTKLMFRTLEELLLRFVEFSDEVGVPLVFVVAPSMFQVEDKLWSRVLSDYDKKAENFNRTIPNDSLMQFAKKNNLRMLDLLPILQSEAKKGKILYNPKEQHWTSDGNRVVARSLLEYLKTNSLIE